MIELTMVSKRYGAQCALKNVSLSVPEGKTLGVLGQNGAGKTTLLSILTGYQFPSSGKIALGGFDMGSEPRQAKRLLGYLPEHPPLYDEMTVSSFLRFTCELKEVLPSGIKRHLDQVLIATGLVDAAGRKIGNLSKGYRQRVGLAQALCGNPRILVLDEPTAGLDPRQAVEFRETLRGLKQGRTLLFSSHDLNEVQSLCDRVVILRSGAVIYGNDMKNIQSPGGSPLRASIAMSADALIPVLKTLPSVSRVTLIASGSGDETTEVLLEPKAGRVIQRELFTLLCGLQAPILNLTPVGNTLEEIFLKSTVS